MQGDSSYAQPTATAPHLDSTWLRGSHGFTELSETLPNSPQADSTAQFLDWFKTPMPSWGILECYRRRAEELEERRNPALVKPVYAPGSMEWQAEQEKQKTTA